MTVRHSRPSVEDDPRFQQLLSLAMEGNADAQADLFKEFGHVIHAEGQSDDVG